MTNVVLCLSVSRSFSLSFSFLSFSLFLPISLAFSFLSFFRSLHLFLFLFLSFPQPFSLSFHLSFFLSSVFLTTSHSSLSLLLSQSQSGEDKRAEEVHVEDGCVTTEASVWIENTQVDEAQRGATRSQVGLTTRLVMWLVTACGAPLNDSRVCLCVA